MKNNNFIYQDFLSDVKFAIKTKYGNQSSYAALIGYSRKALNKILNNGDEISIHMVNQFCENLDLRIEDYLSCKRG